MLGTIINAATVLLGDSLETFLGGKISDRIRQIVIQGVGLVTLVIGVEMALGTNSVLLVPGSVLIGGILGEWWCLEERLEKLGQWLEEKADRVPVLTRGDFTKGFVTASLVFCVGPMTVVGAMQKGLSGEATLLMIRSVLDGFTSLASATSMGSEYASDILPEQVYLLRLLDSTDVLSSQEPRSIQSRNLCESLYTSQVASAPLLGRRLP
jgi:uncharacterized membrane protein YqgA involved in biofilm formation